MRVPRPPLLVSVRSAAEARTALAGGAQWIDLKEPTRGPLGAVERCVAEEVAAVVAGAAPLSAAGGELLDWNDASHPKGLLIRGLLAVDAVGLIKLGLAGCRGIDWQTAWRQAVQQIAQAGKPAAAVAYVDDLRADAPAPQCVLEAAADATVPWLLLDTFDKQRSRLGDSLPPAKLEVFLLRARSLGLQVAVAGSLDRTAIASLPLELIDLVAVRSAACQGGRTGAVCRDCVVGLVELLATQPRVLPGGSTAGNSPRPTTLRRPPAEPEAETPILPRSEFRPMIWGLPKDFS